MSTSSELLAAIFKAFPPHALESAVFADASVMWGSYIKDKAFEAGIQGQSWDTLPPGFAESHFLALGFMNPDAFVAIVPAYLTSLVEGTQNEFPTFVLGELTRKEEWKEQFDARVTRLTAQQQAVIALVLDVLAKSDRFLRLYPAEIKAAADSWRR